MYANHSNFKFAIYTRKSSEQDDRQMMSIESQEKELRLFAQKNKITIAKQYSDSASALKVNNRPAFAQMMKDLEKGKINALLVWKPDRLARNMIEGGQVIHALQKTKIEVIRTPYSQFLPTDNILPLTIEMGMANQYSVDLSRNVKRGNKTKIESGGFCAYAGTGYLNDKTNKTIIKDPERFNSIKLAFKRYLKGNSSLKEICDWLNNELGYKSRLGNKMRVSSIHRIFSNPFYYGQVRSGRLTANGKHPKMITHTEFLKVQELMSLKGKNGICVYTFPLVGNTKCGECRSTIIAEEKYRYSCPNCRYRRTAKKDHNCPRCSMRISKDYIEKSSRKYTYYYCSKYLNKGCSQGYIRGENLEEEFLNQVNHLTLHKDFEVFTSQWCKLMIDQEQDNKQDQTSIWQSRIETIKLKQDKLLELHLSGVMNTQRFALEDEKFTNELSKIRANLSQVSSLNSLENDVLKNARFIRKVLLLYKNGDIKDKKIIYKKLVSNPQLINGKLNIEWSKPYALVLSLNSLLKLYTEHKEYQRQSGLKKILKRDYPRWLRLVEKSRYKNEC